ncbi:23S rRNA (adenine2030-N6)-methyltransferase [Modicisalibacter muralis]|uniref:Ribosomal RNA large subunit methyltransferase J n=1 Tax=Modicisalibacter muralis TaxID=119000 RepID=A0A1G9KWE6_9GAMM|nr:23S rRNA (adenine(2030)-N(6))-methyltransferase RlmJ [Halomonas muralis]SDL53823.1 23S rRNA (adenine2030-N6)-methyltransferase [Halomonas muralis]
MLAYQHAYHAGNFADVHKHLTLFCVLQHILRKETPVTYVDTHAGRGRYPLTAAETQKLKEYQQGVVPLWQARAALSRSDPLLDGWFDALQRAQAGDGRQLTHYPGSPWWLADSLRSHDRLSLFELHPGEHQHLEAQALPSNARRVHDDGLAGLRSMLPVATPRLCVLIDPSYERKSEYSEVAETLAFVARKARHATVLVWYPLLPAGRHQVLLDEVRRAGVRKLWRSELQRHARGIDEHGMYGSGMLLLNPPWGLGQRLEDAWQALLPYLGKQAAHRGEWWVEE